MKQVYPCFFVYVVSSVDFTERKNPGAQLHVVDSHPDVVEDAVKYIIFLVDANQLFDTALGMYDFSLVIMIAQHAQKVNASVSSPSMFSCFSFCASFGCFIEERSPVDFIVSEHSEGTRVHFSYN